MPAATSTPRQWPPALSLIHISAEPDTVTIYHTNDMHASMISDAFNLAHVTTIKKSTPNSLLLDAGDATQGQPFSMLTKGKSVFELMNAAGYDAMVLGNHEFDYPQETLLENVKTANFPVLAGNLQFGNGSNPVSYTHLDVYKRQLLNRAIS